MRHPKKGIEKTVFLSEDMWTLLSEGRVWLTVYLSCWGSFVRAKHITVWWSFSWGQNASLLHIHTALYIETRSDIPDHNNMKPTKRPPPVSFISVWIQAESIYFPVRYKVYFCKNTTCTGFSWVSSLSLKGNINAQTATSLPDFFSN